MLIKVRYKAVDGYGKSSQFKTLAGAQAYAQKCVGTHPSLGSCYAVSDDGVGKIMASGWYDNGQPFNFKDLFPAIKEGVS